MQNFKRLIVLLIVSAIFCMLYIYQWIYDGEVDIQSVKKDEIFSVKKENMETEKYNDTLLNSYNNELFCPIRSKTGHKSGMYRLLRDIHQRQFLDDCYDENNKFWIYDLTKSCQNIGLFAMLHCWTFYFTQSFLLQRTFLFSGSFYNYAPKEFCDETGYQCFFQPISNCNATDIINHYLDKSYVEWFPRSPVNINIHMFYNLDVFNESIKDIITENVWVLKHHRYSKHHPRHYSIIKRKYGLNDVHEYSILLWNIFLRLKPNLQQEINEIVTRSLINANIIHAKYSKIETKNVTLSMPIRWGDKCQNNPANRNKSDLHPEIICWNVDEYMEIAQILKKMNPNLKYIIITSETREIVENITNNYTNIGYKYIVNVDDVMQGNSVFFRSKYSSNNDPIINILSLLSTVRLHFASKYFIFPRLSNWIMSIFNMAITLECEPIKFMDQDIQYQYKTNNDMECIELIMAWAKNAQNPEQRKAVLSKNLRNIYLQRQWKPHRFNIKVWTNSVCDASQNYLI